MNIISRIRDHLHRRAFRRGFEWTCFEHLHNGVELYELDAVLPNHSLDAFYRGALAAIRELSSIRNGEFS